MKSIEQTFGKDHIIFREGDPSDAVYVVLNGRVELLKNSPEGSVTLAILGPLEMFGEMSLEEEHPRGTTARTLEKCKVKVIPKNEFRDWLQQDPDAAVRVMNVLMERLRAADAIIARQRDAAQLLMGAPPTRFNLVDLAINWLRRRRGPPEPQLLLGPPRPSTPPFVIGVATVNNDTEDGWTNALVSLLENRPGIAVRHLPVSLQMEPGADQAQATAAFLRARQMLAREDGMDLLIWGDVHAEGYSLWFTSVGPVDDDRPGSFGPFFRLELPPDQEPPVADLMALAALAAIEPITETHKMLHREMLPPSLEALPDFIDNPPQAWTLEQQRTALTCYGHAAATIATWEDDPDWFDHAADAYAAAVHRLPGDEHGLDQAVSRKHLGGALLASGDRRRDPEKIEQAVTELRYSAECIMKIAFPQEWAAAQNRLGLALYKLDLLTGRAEVLKDALTSFQSALSVYSRVETPQRWADAMDNLAQVLQVYGDQVRSPDVLQRAVDACRATLEVRNRYRAPQGWASSQNTLGTALFLLDKHQETTDHLEEAEAAFTAAAEVYRATNMPRLAAIAEKNLGHVHRLMAIRKVRKVVQPDWAEFDEEEGEEEEF